MSCESAITVIFGDGVHVGSITRLDCITLCSFLWCNAPAIVDAIQRSVMSDDISTINKTIEFTLGKLCF